MSCKSYPVELRAFSDKEHLPNTASARPLNVQPLAFLVFMSARNPHQSTDEAPKDRNLSWSPVYGYIVDKQGWPCHGNSTF